MGIFVTGVAFAVRLVWVLLVPTRPVGDFAMYLESARYLVEHHALDPEFIYMPGYVFVVAAIDALGGGLLAFKMIGVASGALTTAAAYGTARALFGRPAAIAAGFACALWPAGIAVASVTGTDMPAAALLATAGWLLARNAGDRPLGAPVLFGVALGLAAYVRAVALPLAALAVLHFRARGARWLHAFTRTALAGLVALVVLLPWALHNRHLTGEFSFTDSHGGHTALVGANPNSEGTYSRSLNRLFTAVTGYALFAPPYRDADRAAYALAREWARFEPLYTTGLLAAKADRLLTHERALLYWPLYRQSVLPPGSPTLRWFSNHRAGVERLVDGFWYLLVAAIVLGIVASVSRRNGAALSLLPLPFALAVLYTLFFAEVRYHLAIVALLLPFAGAGVVWLGEAAHAFGRWAIERHRRPGLLREAGVAVLVLVAIFWGWPRVVAAGARLRERHRWAVCVCTVGGANRPCAVRATVPAPGEGPSPVRGVWDGFGLRLSESRVAAATDIDVPAGRYRLSMRADSMGYAPDGTRLTLRAAGNVVARADWPVPGTEVTLEARIGHPGGKLHIELGADSIFLAPSDDVPSLWVSGLEVEPDSR